MIRSCNKTIIGLVCFIASAFAAGCTTITGDADKVDMDRQYGYRYDPAFVFPPAEPGGHHRFRLSGSRRFTIAAITTPNPAEPFPGEGCQPRFRIAIADEVGEVVVRSERWVYVSPSRMQHQGSEPVPEFDYRIWRLDEPVASISLERDRWYEISYELLDEPRSDSWNGEPCVNRVALLGLSYR